ncbi:hypothetical protein C0J52_26598 [Blattella germanica]|nr:hypothetical protein C0J52_26598 [Blattella germanica]
MVFKLIGKLFWNEFGYTLFMELAHGVQYTSMNMSEYRNRRERERSATLKSSNQAGIACSLLVSNKRDEKEACKGSAEKEEEKLKHQVDWSIPTKVDAILEEKNILVAYHSDINEALIKMYKALFRIQFEFFDCGFSPHNDYSEISACI